MLIGKRKQTFAEVGHLPIANQTPRITLAVAADVKQRDHTCLKQKSTNAFLLYDKEH